MRMRSDRRINVVVLFGKLDCAFQSPAVRITGANIENCANSCIARALNHFLTVGIVLRAVNVGVGIYKHDRKDLTAKATK